MVGQDRLVQNLHHVEYVEDVASPSFPEGSWFPLKTSEAHTDVAGFVIKVKLGHVVSALFQRGKAPRGYFS